MSVPTVFGSFNIGTIEMQDLAIAAAKRAFAEYSAEFGVEEPITLTITREGSTHAEVTVGGPMTGGIAKTR